MALFLSGALAACGQGGDLPGDPDDHRPYAGIAPEETLRFTGTEPFWGGEVRGDSLHYSTPDNPGGETITVTRFGGRGGLSYSGELARGPMTMMVGPGSCSDGMSDRTYPYVVTLSIGEEVRNGCGWTEATGYVESAPSQVPQE